MKQLVYVEACRRVLHRPIYTVAGFAGILALAGVVYWWLAMPVARMWDLVLLAVTGLAALIMAAGLAWKGLTAFRCAGSSLPRAAGKGPFWLAGMIGLGTGILLPWLLIRWVPEVHGLWPQAASMGIRFTIAGLCFVSTVLWLGAVAAQLGEPHGEELHAGEQSQDQAG